MKKLFCLIISICIFCCSFFCEGTERQVAVESLNQQVIELYQQGRYIEAIPIAEKVLEIRENALGPEHPKVAAILNNLAVLHHKIGDYSQAIILYQRTLEIKKKILGPEHPDVADSLNNLAGLYDDQALYQEAETLHNQALDIRKNALGLEHPSVAQSLNNLAMVHFNTGDYPQPSCYISKHWIFGKHRWVTMILKWRPPSTIWLNFIKLRENILKLNHCLNRH